MRRDSIFCKLFQRLPKLLFQLVADPPENAAVYRFALVMKEMSFRIAAMFLPLDLGGVIDFAEMQFQPGALLFRTVWEMLLISLISHK